MGRLAPSPLTMRGSGGPPLWPPDPHAQRRRGRNEINMRQSLRCTFRKLNWILLGGLLLVQDVLPSLGGASPWFVGLQTLNAMALVALVRKA